MVNYGHSGGFFAKDVTFHGGDDEDSLAIVGNTVTDIVYKPNAGSGDTARGTIQLDDATITFTGLEPALVTTGSTTFTIDLSALGAGETVRIMDDGTVGNGISRVEFDSTSLEDLDFANPSGELIILANNAFADTINVQGLDSLFNADVTITGGDDDYVNFTGSIGLGDNDLTVTNARTISVAAGVAVATTGDGAVDLTAVCNITLASGSSITTVDGAVTLKANQQATPTTGSFVGIDVNNAMVESTTGSITVQGRGGDHFGGSQFGVRVQDGGKIGNGTSGTVTVMGTGGASTGSDNYGVRVVGSGSTVTSGGGNVSVTGTGGGTGASSSTNVGVIVSNVGKITAGSSGAVTVVGNGGNASGSGSSNFGVWVEGTNSRITSGGGNVSVTGSGGGASSSSYNRGVAVTGAGEITAENDGTVTVTGYGGNTSGIDNHGVYVWTSDSQITSGGGNVSVTGTGGGSGSGSFGVFVQSGVTLAISATGAATLDITGNGSGSAAGVRIDSPISSGTGSVTIQSVDDNIMFGAGGDITSTSGTVTVTADTAVGNHGGAIVMADGAVIDAGSGTIALTADGDVTLGRLVTTNATDTAVTVNSTSGGVIDGGDTGGVDVHAPSGRLVITAATGIGTAGAIDTTVDSLDLNVSGTGAIQVNETDAVTLSSVTTADGTTEIDAGGTITAELVTAAGSGSDVRLTATASEDDDGDIALGVIIAGGDRVLLQAAGAITDGNDGDNNVTASQLAMTAGTGIGAADSAIHTTVGTLAASATTGDIWVVNSVHLVIGSVTAFNTPVIGVTGGGKATITAFSALTLANNVIMTGDVLLTAADSAESGDDLTVRSDVLVRSQTSTVELRAGDNMTLEDCSTVSAPTSTITLRGDYADPVDVDPGVGSTMQLLGTLESNGSLQSVVVEGGPDADTITLNPGSGHFAHSTKLDGKGGGDLYQVYMGRLLGTTANGKLDAVYIDDRGTSGTDRAEVHGTDVGELFNVHNLGITGGGDKIGGIVHNTTIGEQVEYTGTLEQLTVFGENEDENDNPTHDTFFVEPSQTTEITINGNFPTWGPAAYNAPQIDGDLLDFDSFGNTFLLICGTVLTDHPSDVPAAKIYRPVNYRSIENMPLTPLGATTRRFDMDSTPAALQTGYTSVLPTTVYGVDGNTFGWDAALNGFDRGTASFSSDFTDLLRDGHWNSAPRTFTAEVANGWYLVSIKTGDKSFARDRLQVTHGDIPTQILIDNLASPAGQIVDRAFVMLVEDGTLDLTFANMGGDPYWVVNSIEIRPGKILTFGSPERADALLADGVTQTTFAGYNATPGALITVDPQLDTQGDYLPEGTVTILGTDADPDVAGFQVRANDLSEDPPLYPGMPAGYFEYTIVRPSVAGTMRVLYTEVTGAQASCFSVDFEAPEIRRFDFNSGASPTQTPVAEDGQDPADPGYVGVLPNQLTSSAVGYGWVSPVSGFDRGAINSPGYSNLVRDGAWGSGPGDFRMQLPPNKTYDVTVTFGDASFARDRMNVTVVEDQGQMVSGSENVTNVATAAGQFVHRSFVAAPDEQGELVLRFSDGGGDPYWTVVAVEVRPVYTPFTVTAPNPDGSLVADGMNPTPSRDTFTINNYTPNAWYTVSTTMGRVFTGDEDDRYAGVQLQAPASGTFQIEIERGTSDGTATVRVEEVNGASRGSTTQDYVYAPVRRFDFNGSGVDTQVDTGDPVNPWWNVRGADVFDAAIGHGWNAAVGEFQRSAAGISQPQLESLYRDGHWQSGTRTFQAGVDPAKTYDVRIHTGDRSFARDRLQVTVEGTATVPTEIATAANEFQAITVQNVTASDGILDIRIANLGGDPYWVINGIEVAESIANDPAGPGLPALPVPPPPEPSEATLRFDFGTSSSPKEDDFTQVGATNVYNPDLGYGWTTAAPTFNRSISNDLLRDGHWGTNNVFLVNVNAGSYIVNVTVGDANFARNRIEVSVNDVVQIENLSTAAGQFVHATTAQVSPADGQLAIRVRNTGGDPYFTINALEIFEAPQGSLGFEIGGNPVTSISEEADGTTWDTITVTNATEGAMYTVRADVGTVRGPEGAEDDASTAYAGFQVEATGTSVSFQVRRPTGLGSGAAKIRVEEVTGLKAGSLDQTYTLPTVRRFDFNGSGNVLQSGFTPVRGNNLYNDTNGFGWTTAVSEFQRANAATPTPALHRDGHWGSAVRTFQVSADSSTYNVRVYVGDASFARDRIEASVNGSDWIPMAPISVAANNFATILVENVTAQAGKLNISIRDAGGDPYWVVNGMDVWTGTDPAEDPLLAATWGTEMVGGWLTEAAVEAVLPVARDYWVSTGLAGWQVAELYRTPMSIGDLSYRGALGVTKPEGIWLDASGAGLGWSVGSGQWAVVTGTQTTANGQLPTAAYDLLTVVTHELGHVLGYGDLDGKGDRPLLPERPEGCCAQKGTVPFSSSDHIMAGVLRPGASRIELPAGDQGRSWTLGEGASLLSLDRADGKEPAAIGDRAVQRAAVDRVIDDLLRDDLRVSKDAWQRDEDDEFERLVTGRSGTQESDIDDFFAQL
jgi:fibronectin type 3 domain-containing protein